MGHCQKHGLYSTFCRACDLDTIKDNQMKEDMSHCSKLKSYIVYDSGQRPWPDEVNHITHSEVVDVLIEKINVKIVKMCMSELIELAKQADIIIEEIE